MKLLRVALAILLILPAAGASAAVIHAAAAKRFASVDAAVDALMTAVRAHDRKALNEIFGPRGRPLVSSGDPVADRRAFDRFASEYDKNHRIEAGGGKVVLVVGADDFPFPIPLVPDGPSWRWDADAGADELVNRRIGRNELSAIQVCLAYVDAQREYYAGGYNSGGVLAYAQRIVSTPGKRDGLYWPEKPGEPQSPLGPLAARAQAAGYTPGKSSTRSHAPFHGYFYRLLMRQGPNAQGGAYEYVLGRHQIGGFALIAVPAVYGVSGVMTFMVNHDGAVYERDLGLATTKAAGAIQSFDPDAKWKRVPSVATAAK
jgi:hypothetical protein